MHSDAIKDHVLTALDDLKAQDIKVLSVAEITSVADWMVVASGTSSRHIKSLANNVNIELKQLGVKPLGIEGEDSAEWVLVDFGAVVVHLMLPETRRFYDLESLWGVVPKASMAADSDLDGEH